VTGKRLGSDCKRGEKQQWTRSAARADTIDQDISPYAGPRAWHARCRRILERTQRTWQ
jgi:hypothetical protein